MKTSIFVQLSTLLLRESFGDIVAKVVVLLLRRPKSPLRVVVAETGVSLKQVKLAIAIGIQHNVISFAYHKRGFVEYSADYKMILHRARFPHYINCVKALYGDIAEVIIEEILAVGQTGVKRLIDKVISRLSKHMKDGQKLSSHDIELKITDVKKSGFVEVCANLVQVNGKLVPPNEASESPPPAKRQKTEEANEDDNDFLRINMARMDLYLRDLEIVKSTNNKLGPIAGEIMAAMLRLSEVKSDLSALESAVITANEIFAGLPKTLSIKRSVMEQLLTIMCDDQMNALTKVGDSSSGSYVINFNKVVESISFGHIESLIQERFGSKSLRIFKLLLLKRHLEQKQIEEMAMVPAKEAKELLYTMFTQGFVTTTEVAKTADHAPSRTYYLFRVDNESVARKALDWSCRTMFNCLLKRRRISEESRRLIEKQQRVEAIISTLNEQPGDGESVQEQMEEVQEMITPAEKQQLISVKHHSKQLEMAELQLDCTTLMLDLHTQYIAGKRLFSIC